MTIVELNEAIDYNNEGIVVYLDKENSTFRFADPNDLAKRGLTFTVFNKADYKKLSRKYKIESNFDEFTKISNSVKKSNKSVDIRRVLASMQKDLFKILKSKK